MWEELQPLRRHWKLEWTGPGEFFTGRWAGLRLQVALSGVGHARAQSACSQLARYGRPDVLLSLGYSGALRPDLRAGSCILADRILTSSTTWESPGLSPLEQSFHGWRVGTLFCTDKVVMSKHRLAEQYPLAQAVDMESAALAAAACEQGLPWRALRVIVDDLHTELPLDFSTCLNERGQMHATRLARAIASKPHRIGRLIRFSGHANRARQSLVENASRYLEVLSPW